MPDHSSRAVSSPAAGLSAASPGNTTPVSALEQKRLFRLRIRERTAQFAARLKTNLKWMKKFLHGSQ